MSGKKASTKEKGEERYIELTSPTDGAILQVYPDLSVKSIGFDEKEPPEEPSGSGGNVSGDDDANREGDNTGGEDQGQMSLFDYVFYGEKRS